MKCTDNNQRNNPKTRSRGSRSARRRRGRKKIIYRRILIVLMVLLVVLLGVGIKIVASKLLKPKDVALAYETMQYNTSVYTGKLLADSYCVTTDNVELADDNEKMDTTGFTEAALFDLDNAKVDYAQNVFDKLYPASTTKILTALIALENTKLTDVVTVADEAGVDQFAEDESTCGIEGGDKLTMKDLLYGMLLESGNDNAAAIAYYISGSMDDFADLMNQRAEELLATHSHFVNSNGLHDEDHYTTAYDLYLIFNECIKHQEFVDIISTDSYTATITSADGTERTMEWAPTNYYQQGISEVPEGVTVIGGKTGTTDEAGSCLILLTKDDNQHPYISIVMGADTKDILYQDMTTILSTIPDKSSSKKTESNDTESNNTDSDTSDSNQTE